MNKHATGWWLSGAALAAMVMGAASVQAADADDRIEEAFRSSHVHRTHLKDDSVRIAAEDGIVTLTGTVADQANRDLAAETAANLPGVVRVDNQLETQAEEASASADTWIGRRVKLALMFHRNVSARATTVEVKDGVVTLTGEADSQAQKDLTAEYAKDIEGVTRVDNRLTVATTPAPASRTAGQTLDDASITAQVKSALANRRSTSALDIKVQTREGEVTLTGIAANAAEKSLVSKLVGDIQGVTKVTNRMTLQQAMAR